MNHAWVARLPALFHVARWLSITREEVIQPLKMAPTNKAVGIDPSYLQHDSIISLFTCLITVLRMAVV